MIGHRDPLPIRFYRWALVILPRGFRRDRGPAMVAMLSDEWRELRGRKRVILVARSLHDLLWTAVVERTSRSSSGHDGASVWRWGQAGGA